MKTKIISLGFKQVLLACLLFGIGLGAPLGAANTEIGLNSAQEKLGKRAFIRCQACHTLGEGEEHRTGPNLYGLFGASAGKKVGFAYSDVLANSSIEWNKETLVAWLKSPSAFLPGNKMAFAGVPSEKEMAALMLYLEVKTK